MTPALVILVTRRHILKSQSVTAFADVLEVKQEYFGE